MGNELLLTLALTVFCGSIFVFFSQEFIRLFKKIMSIPSVKLLLPLAFASCCVEAYEDWSRWLLLRLQAGIDQILYHVAALLPLDTRAITIIRIVYLFILAELPLWIYIIKVKQQRRRHPKPFSYRPGLALWLVAAILLTVLG